MVGVIANMSQVNREPHWIPCPMCNEKTDTKVYADTSLFNYPLCCPRCGKETLINVFQLRMVVADAQRSGAEIITAEN